MANSLPLVCANCMLEQIERVNAGLQAARRRGRIGGRPRRLDDEKIAAARALLETGMTISSAARAVVVPRSTLVDSLGRFARQASETNRRVGLPIPPGEPGSANLGIAASEVSQ